MTSVSKKKRNPPQFHHLPKDRAKQLKSSWLHTQKIKSKWRSEKRREGLSSRPEHKEMSVVGGDNQQSTYDESIGQGTSESKPSDKHDRLVDESRNGVTDKSGLRDLAKKAYASSSLHNYKSDPLHKRRGREGRQSQGRGQPNMKLRMNAMLEKIKQDTA